MKGVHYTEELVSALAQRSGAAPDRFTSVADVLQPFIGSIPQALAAMRASDGSFPANPETLTGGTGAGEWRPTPPAFAPMATPWLGAVTPFTLKDPTRFRMPPPPSLSSGRYVRDYNEVKTLGSINSTARTQAQTDLALFYSDNFLALWERTLRGIADTNISNIGDSARLFALANLATADAIITACRSPQRSRRIVREPMVDSRRP